MFATVVLWPLTLKRHVATTIPAEELRLVLAVSRGDLAQAKLLQVGGSVLVLGHDKQYLEDPLVVLVGIYMWEVIAFASVLLLQLVMVWNSKQGITKTQ